MIPTVPELEDYGLSPERGFLPDYPPLACLSDPYYAPWESLVANLVPLVKSQKIRDVVDSLPVLSPDGLVSDVERRRAYMILGFFAHSYIWGGANACERLPPSIAVPFLSLSETLDIPPVATYAAACLWNYGLKDPANAIDDPENLESLLTFTGTEDEAWFYLISVAIEARGAPTIALMLAALRATRGNDRKTVIDCLKIFSSRLQDLTLLLRRMHEKCRPHVFYFEIRPFLAGSKRMAEAGLPRGVFYDTGRDSDTYREYSGGSNAQSSLFQAFDIIMGVEHYPTGTKKDPAAKSREDTPPAPKHSFMQEMRKYMPGEHRRFLEHLDLVPNIHRYVEHHQDDTALRSAYNSCLSSLEEFRCEHKSIVTRYIVIPANAARESASVKNVAKSMALESESPLPQKLPGQGLGLASNGAARNGLKGTGGTQLMPFLEQARAETIGSVVGDTATTTLSLTKAEGFRRSWTTAVPRQEDFCQDIGGGALLRQLG